MSTCVMKVIKDMTATLPNFKASSQLMGFSGSSGPSHQTMFGSGGSTAGISVSVWLVEELFWPVSRSRAFAG